MQVNINCICGQANQTVTLVAESLPAEMYLDHSNDARYSTGMLCASYLPLKQPPQSQGNLRAYKLGEEVICLFCERCSCHAFRHHESTNAWLVASGVVQNAGDVIKVVGHFSIEEPIDGGLASFMPKLLEQQNVKAVEDVAPRRSEGVDTERNAENGRPLELRAQCHCGGVDFFVTPPNTQSEGLTSPWPDLLVPYHSGSPENADDVKWWLRASKTKYLAGLCACRSCRQSAGFPIQAWTFIPRFNLVGRDGTSFDLQSNKLMRYESTPGVYREACRTCGATVFWHCNERPDLIDVSVGLLRARTGALAQEWLDWHRNRISFVEDALDQRFAKALEVPEP
jgi:hypothetical protein